MIESKSNRDCYKNRVLPVLRFLLYFVEEDIPFSSHDHLKFFDRIVLFLKLFQYNHYGLRPIPITRVPTHLSALSGNIMNRKRVGCVHTIVLEEPKQAMILFSNVLRHLRQLLIGEVVVKAVP
jgi:hypothetical protein